jgi:hypothetical protein
LDLGYRPWAPDFTPDDAGNPPFPWDEIVNPYQLDANGNDSFLEWTTQDWDPALRFWTLPYDRHLNQWLKSVDASKPSIMAACEFGGQEERWRYGRDELLKRCWLETLDLAWQPDPKLKPAGAGGSANAGWMAVKAAAFGSIQGEIQQLQMLMEDDRDRYLNEIIEQADGLAGYIIAFVNTYQSRYPWTIELVNCGLAIGNIAYFSFKQHFKRVRPSTLCPGLAPPFGPPGHPSFTSGHSFLGHLIALLLLEIPAVQQRFGMFNTPFDGRRGGPVASNVTAPATITIANPALVTLTVDTVEGYQLGVGDQIVFEPVAGGGLPAPILPDTLYYILGPLVSGSSFNISAAPNGPAISTAGAAGAGPVAALIPRNPLAGRRAFDSPLLWLAERIAKNRERLGVHYPSDSAGSRHLAAGIWQALLHDDSDNGIYCPTLDTVLAHAKAEWPVWR